MISVICYSLLTFVGPSEAALSPRELAPGVFVLASSSKYNSENIGWVVSEDRVILIGIPHPDRLASIREQVARTTDRPIKTAILLQSADGDLDAARVLGRTGIEIIAHQYIASNLTNIIEDENKIQIRKYWDRLNLSNEPNAIEVIGQGSITGRDVAVAYLPGPRVLFAGAMCINGPRADLFGRDTRDWLSALRGLQALPCLTIVPGSGTIGDASILDRQVRFLRELRRQVGHLIAQERRLDDIVNEVKIAPEFLVWMPYDQPTRQDIEHIYLELTGFAVFETRVRPMPGPRIKALALIGDSPHDPDHIETGLRHALGHSGISTLVTVDFRELSAKNLKDMHLLVMLRDGAIWPNGRDKPSARWMTPEQEQAIVAFVEQGGGLLALHNSTALYPEADRFFDWSEAPMRGTAHSNAFA